jgi:hypothetical protein
MTFERHAFISYAHIDNQPLPTETDGWVSLFHAALQQMLAGRLGGTANIWRDERLRGNDVFASEIVANFQNTAVLVSVLTPRYVKSDWCRREISEFCEVAEHNGGLLVDNKCRVFKVFKFPLEETDDDVLPPVIQQVLGYDFYETDEDKTTTRELAPSYGEKSKQDFLRKVAKLAFDIKLLLGRLEAHTPPAAAESTRPTVYLATCSHDRREAREMLELELQRMGYLVLPDRQLPVEEVAFMAEVKLLLARSRVSIHLVGSSYGLVPDGPTDKSVVMLQNELAAQRCHAGALSRLIWLPQGTASSHPLQTGFIAALHNKAEAQFGADLITGDVETLKATMHATLERVQRPAAEALPATPGRRTVHLLCSERDRKDSVPLIKLLRQSAEVTLPVFTGDATAVREANQALLMAADQVVLYYGAGDEAWKYHQQNELRRVRGLRTGAPLPPEHVYLAAPNSDDKDLLVDLGEARLVDGRAGVPAALNLS